jgi:tetratricopeptide (TPR) repeat protein
VLNHLDWTGYGEPQKADWLIEFERYNKAAKYVLKAHAEPAYFARLLACDFGLKALPDFAPLLEQQDACLRDLEVALRDAVMAPERVIADMVFQYQNNPDFAMAWLVRAMALQQQNKLNDALAAAQAALQYAPASAVAYERLGLIHQQLRDYPRAVAELDQAVQLKPGQERLRLRLAEAHHLAGERAEALRQIQESLRINPHYPPAQQRLAEWSTAGGKKE